MKTIILPGYSPSNKEWAFELKDKLKLDHDIFVHEWKHWVSGSFRLDFEIEQIMHEMGEEDVNIIAKSIGTRVSMYLIPLLGVRINKLILCGIPIKNLPESNKSDETRLIYTKGLTSINPSRVLTIQNSLDPWGSFSEIQEFIQEINKDINVVEKEAKTHDYPYFQDIQEFLE